MLLAAARSKVRCGARARTYSPYAFAHESTAPQADRLEDGWSCGWCYRAFSGRFALFGFTLSFEFVTRACGCADTHHEIEN